MNLFNFSSQRRVQNKDISSLFLVAIDLALIKVIQYSIININRTRSFECHIFVIDNNVDYWKGEVFMFDVDFTF
jgi:hypothetical protein